MKKTLQFLSGVVLTIAGLVGVWPVDADEAAYTVVDGTKVDPGTFSGFMTWKTAGCGRCHGANQEGIVGPSLVERLKTLTKADFVTTVIDGRVPKGMPSFAANKSVAANIDNLYAYLKGRSDGRITAATVQEIGP